MEKLSTYDWDSLTQEERIERCLVLAEKALTTAALATTRTTAEQYHKLSLGWIEAAHLMRAVDRQRRAFESEVRSSRSQRR
jgi:hypothetical protein